MVTSYYTEGPRMMSFSSTSFRYNVDEMLWELKPCLYPLAFTKIGFIMRRFTYSRRT